MDLKTIPEIRQEKESVCGKTFAVVYKYKYPDLSLIKVPLKCNSWICPTCSRKRSRQWSKSVDNYFKQDKLNMLTLTIDPKKTNIHQSFAEIAKYWNRLKTAIVRKYGVLKYVRIMETTKKGYPHYHIIINKFLPSDWLNIQIPKAGFGKIYDIKAISGSAAFNYVKKYLQKKIPNTLGEQLIFANRLRRVSGGSGFILVGKSSGKYNYLGFFSNSFEATQLMHKVIEHFSDSPDIRIQEQEYTGFLAISFDGLGEKDWLTPCDFEKRFNSVLDLISFDSAG